MNLIQCRHISTTLWLATLSVNTMVGHLICKYYGWPPYQYNTMGGHLICITLWLATLSVQHYGWPPYLYNNMVGHLIITTIWLATLPNLLIKYTCTGEGHATSLKSAKNKFAIIFHDVTYIYPYKIWHIYHLSC